MISGSEITFFLRQSNECILSPCSIFPTLSIRLSYIRVNVHGLSSDESLMTWTNTWRESFIKHILKFFLKHQPWLFFLISFFISHVSVPASAWMSIRNFKDRRPRPQGLLVPLFCYPAWCECLYDAQNSSVRQNERRDLFSNLFEYFIFFIVAVILYELYVL